MIDRHHIRYFLAVLDRGNFSKAAEACNVSQPTLSVGISKLEQAIGRPLFLRTNKRTELTAAGAELTAYARRIESAFTQAERTIAATEIVDTLRLGVLTTIPVEWIERFLLEYRAGGGVDRIELSEGRERELTDRLERGRIDVALTIARDDRLRGANDVIFVEGYALAMSAHHPLARRDTLRAEELVNEPMIVRRHCELLPETSRYFTARGVRPFFSAKTANDARALAYVQAGLGVTVMPDCFVQPGIVRPLLEDFPFTRTIGLQYGDHCDNEAIKASPVLRSLVGVIERIHRRQRNSSARPRSA